MNRRHFLGTLASTTLLFSRDRASAQTDTLETIIGEVAADPSIVENSWLYREHNASKGVGQGTPSMRKLPPSAIDLIVAFEIASPTVYEAKYRRPIWPKGESGVTIGVGYDLRFANKSTIDRDWHELPQDWRELLYPACGLGGAAAASFLKSVRVVEIHWEAARKQFLDFLPYPTKETENVFPNCDKLSDECFGSLVSIVYNRGSQVSRSIDRRREMYEIRQLMKSGDRSSFRQIPSLIRSMKRIWEGNPEARGLIKRREAEAILFERGLGG
ncbi:hypothetical protein [Mesorhizobium sp. M0011]|uniref:hypothetical protein n=1 Tax=Mesorhizobium sp. M0011 TaxID=2956839 RepID=UPI00333DB114